MPYTRFQSSTISSVSSYVLSRRSAIFVIYTTNPESHLLAVRASSQITAIPGSLCLFNLSLYSSSKASTLFINQLTILKAMLSSKFSSPIDHQKILKATLLNIYSLSNRDYCKYNHLVYVRLMQETHIKRTKQQ